MAANEIHVGDTGTRLTVVITDNGTAVDISTASTKSIYLLSPSGTVLTKSGTFTTTGTDGSMYYDTLSTDLSVPGLWSIQAYIVIGTTSFKSDVQAFVVHPNLA